MQPTTPRQRRNRVKQPMDVVRELREAAGLSQYELARRTGLSRSLICEIESGRRGLTPSSQRLIAKVLDVPAEKFSPPPAAA